MNIVLLCGGSGTRLWPLSRKKLPKQFLALVNEHTMFQNTILRFQTSSLNIRKFVIFKPMIKTKHLGLKKNPTKKLLKLI